MVDVGTQQGYLYGSFDSSYDCKIEVSLIGESLGSTEGKVIGSDEGIKLGSSGVKVIGAVLIDVDVITLGC